PVLDEQLVRELELPTALGRVGDGEEQVDLAAPQALEALLPGALDVLERPPLLPGDVLEHVHVDALGTAPFVAEDQRRVRVRADAERCGRVEGRRRGEQDAGEGDEGGQRAVSCCHWVPEYDERSLAEIDTRGKGSGTHAAGTRVTRADLIHRLWVAGHGNPENL